jgi:hypothetical protein
LWTVTVGPERLLAHINNVRLDESGESEDEYVIDPTVMQVDEIR